MHFATYKDYLNHPLFKAIRAAAMARSGGKCVYCGAPATEVHHRVYPKPWGTFDVPENIEPICHECHCKHHGEAI